MELHAYTKTINDIFAANKKYIVPRFQREYSWSTEEVNELWEDIIFNIEIKDNNEFHHEEHFIGALVLVGEDKSQELKIVDGQQRLTTLTIFLSALCERFMTIENKTLAEAIYNNFIAGKDSDGEDYFKLKNESPKPFFQTRIQDIEKNKNKPNTEEEKTLLKSYNQLYDNLDREKLSEVFKDFQIDQNSNYERLLKEIRDQVLSYLKVIYITVKEEDQAYTIFETLNARGINLSFVDLIKNKLFKELKKQHPDDTAKTKWKKLRSLMSSREGLGSLETFVRHWWISRYSYVSAKHLYKAFRKKWNTNEINASQFIDDLISDAEKYIKIASPNLDDWKHQHDKDIYRSLNALKIFNVSQNRPFILSLFRAKEAKIIKFSELKNILKFIETFHFTFTAVCSMRPSGIEASYSKAARDIFQAKSQKNLTDIIMNFKNQLKKRIPNKNIFQEKFEKLKYPNNQKLINYIFVLIEVSKSETKEFQPEDLTLEHILPQSSGKDDCLGKIGNLLPLGKNLNQKAGNKSFQEKIKIYQESEFYLTREFVANNYQTWGEEQINERTNELADYCYDLLQTKLEYK
ncbi:MULTISPECIES: DUF262 domain-containing HNH endonuclease family protein [unclassified Moorena]|uniref:DUF262 domain-containing protein n=1 Tax=unclassified Moorena TaxID=2683338 RepID=UPI0013FF08A3|nr:MULTISPECIES: DUF262 domain-containing HNH endonuclease family protein [unclassified Moorena]NEO14987.1 DUF262 domain-containing protein [Moorena sp. SIO3E8]NEQ02248.1 DUF262 domain-containing protein [Moorena sp. SIO3F7]